jgi:hypothetical protein
MSTLVIVAVTAVVFILVGATICISGVAMWYMLKMIRELRAAVDKLTTATNELLGEGSFTRISKSLQVLAGNIPEILGGLREFTRVMSLVFRSTETEATSRSAVPFQDNESAFFPGKTDAEAAVQEETNRAREQKLILSDEQLSQMHTDEAT